MGLSHWFQQWQATTSNLRKVVAINERNLRWIYPNNNRRDYPLADDKNKTKERMAWADVPMPRTFKTYGAFFELRTLEKDLEGLREFVIKPATGSMGGGILVIARREGSYWYTVGGQPYSLDDLARHITDIIFGIHSSEMTDSAFIEERIKQHPVLEALTGSGLSDVRVLLFHGRPVMAMLRLPTKESQGKSNLHQGALGVGVDLATGFSIHASHFGKSITIHPDTESNLIGIQIPFWHSVLDVAKRAAGAMPLKYLGADIAITPKGPVMLEINARPGLEIQNVNGRGFGDLLEAIETDVAEEMRK